MLCSLSFMKDIMGQSATVGSNDRNKTLLLVKTDTDDEHETVSEHFFIDWHSVKNDGTITVSRWKMASSVWHTHILFFSFN